MKLLIPDSVSLERDVDPRVEVCVYDASLPIPDEHEDTEIFVAWGNNAANLESATRLPRLKWVQALSAGAEKITGAGFADDVVIANGSGVHNRTVAEHATALALALLRRLPASAAAQREHVWSSELGGIQPMHPSGAVTSLIRARVLVWGFGQIGQHLARILDTIGADVRGVARSAGERGGFEVIAETDIEAALPETDVLIMILPGVAATKDSLNAARLAALPKHACVVNVGRGTTVDEVALVDALESGSIAGAAIDVTAVEPLPAESPLWDAPNLIITPHAAGGRPDLGPELIRENLARYLAGEPLKNVVKR
ncbi:NAD(P)-dependent oxidoreductase [Microbacterium halophytorum]|uniref:NAD(P)-dependent oxidoreductase n=1 Tax=Microbacterium halophytorum TaxID=2067568 RepID=UPI000CFD9598|nr:NAD(P)-dependent oxidoreductase [Microbacterium halophytorum]